MAYSVPFWSSGNFRFYLIAKLSRIWTDFDKNWWCATKKSRNRKNKFFQEKMINEKFLYALLS